MTPEQEHDVETISASEEPRPETSPCESAPGLPEDDRSNKRADSDRRGWRAYFPAAARKELPDTLGVDGKGSLDF